MAMAFLLLGLGFLLGILSLAIAEGLALLWAIRSLTRRSSASRATPHLKDTRSPCLDLMMPRS
jgi:hypothetical protein